MTDAGWTSRAADCPRPRRARDRRAWPPGRPGPAVASGMSAITGGLDGVATGAGRRRAGGTPLGPARRDARAGWRSRSTAAPRG